MGNKYNGNIAFWSFIISQQQCLINLEVARFFLLLELWLLKGSQWSVHLPLLLLFQPGMHAFMAKLADEHARIEHQLVSALLTCLYI